jgi:uroporphyrinogen decarboxylase
MNSKERVIAAIRHSTPDRVPVDIRYAPELGSMLRGALGLRTDADLQQWFGQDVVPVRPEFPSAVSPIKYADPTIRIDANGYYRDIYGVPFKLMENDLQSYLETVQDLPLKDLDSIADLERYPWPTTEPWDYSKIEGQIDANTGSATWCRSRGFFTTSQLMRGMDGFLVDLMLNQDYAHSLIGRIIDFVFEDARKTLEAGKGKYTFIEYNDDFGMQNSMMLSPDLWREFAKPEIRKFAELAHRNGAFLKCHSCGSIYPIIPDLIEVGVDILNPIQPLAKDMDPFRLKKEFGKDLCFHGAVDIQNLLPFATAIEVGDHVKKLIDVVGECGGFIISGSHTLQADAKVENIIALREAIHSGKST